MSPAEAIQALLARGLTESAIAAKVGARQSTINRIKRLDMVPNWETGKALVDMAAAAASGRSKRQPGRAH